MERERGRERKMERERRYRSLTFNPSHITLLHPCMYIRLHTVHVCTMWWLHVCTIAAVIKWVELVVDR